MKRLPHVRKEKSFFCCFSKPILFTVFLNKDLWHPNCIESHTNNFLKYFFCMFVFVHYLTEKPKYFTTTMYKFSICEFFGPCFFVKSNNYIFFLSLGKSQDKRWQRKNKTKLFFFFARWSVLKIHYVKPRGKYE